MSSNNINYRDQAISLYQLSDESVLLLKIYAESFSYAVINQHKLVALAENCDLQELGDPGEAHDLLTYDFHQVVAAIPATAFTLVPNELYNADRITDYARFLDVKPNEKIFSQPLDDENYIIYKAADGVVDTARIFGLHNTVYSAKGMINAIEENNPKADSLYLNIDHAQVEILHFADGNIRFYNTFEFRNADELVYFASFAAKELQLAPQHTTIVLSGDVDQGDQNAKRLAEFFGKVELNTISLIETPAEIPSHKILAFAALSLCVSSGAV